MSLPPLVATTLQAALLAGVSNVLAQTLTAYRSDSELAIDWIPVIQFALYSVLNTPPNFLWQDFLESTFPAHPKPPPTPKSSSSQEKEVQPAQQSAPKLSIRNTITKLALDQTVGASVNTLLVSLYIHSMRTALAGAPRITSLPKAISYWTSPGAVNLAAVDFSAVWQGVLGEFWGLITAGWTFWPAVALINFSFVKTVQTRNLVGAFAGIAWGVYMSLVAAG